jgi:hypothetical protein
MKGGTHPLAVAAADALAAQDGGVAAELGLGAAHLGDVRHELEEGLQEVLVAPRLGVSEGERETAGKKQEKEYVRG